MKKVINIILLCCITLVSAYDYGRNYYKADKETKVIIVKNKTDLVGDNKMTIIAPLSADVYEEAKTQKQWLQDHGYQYYEQSNYSNGQPTTEIIFYKNLDLPY